MSHLWIRDTAGEWATHPLAGDLLQLTPRAPLSLTREQLGAVAGPVLARSVTDHGLESWTLLCAPGHRVRINGSPVPVGIRTLADRDAISLADSPDCPTVFLSLEHAAEIVPFPEHGHDTCCIRCKLPLAPETPAVRCPGRDCGFWHHQSPEQPCWTYTDGCANCGHPTAFDAGFQWTPDLL